ncbi:IMPACT family protein [Tomitella biformata]|uniref:IMPACT family protein n=1 Tax=Tomitella biformata TaxID=630403 RepID=UPI000465849A|nr:YigZ family protein [Tomitella biformata]
MIASYQILAAPVDVEVTIRKSRFLTRLRRVEDEAAARAVIEQTRREHRTANHNCTAFALGPGAQIARSSDDGEPSGTAGLPMLEVLTSRPVSDVVAVVTRYFGGVKLGTGGLVRAYSDAVAGALDEAGTRTRQLSVRAAVAIEPMSAGKLENELRAAGVVVAGVVVAGVAYAADSATADATIEVAVPVAAWPRFLDQIAGLTAGSAEVVELGQVWVDG